MNRQLQNCLVSRLPVFVRFGKLRRRLFYFLLHRFLFLLFIHLQKPVNILFGHVFLLFFLLLLLFLLVLLLFILLIFVLLFLVLFLLVLVVLAVLVLLFLLFHFLQEVLQIVFSVVVPGVKLKRFLVILDRLVFFLHPVHRVSYIIVYFTFCFLVLYLKGLVVFVQCIFVSPQLVKRVAQVIIDRRGRGVLYLGVLVFLQGFVELALFIETVSLVHAAAGAGESGG